MLYYKTKTKKENIIIKGKKEIFNTYEFIDFFISNELVTKKELEKRLNIHKNNIFSFECDELKKNKYYCNFDELIQVCFDEVNINKNKTGFVFGARKELITK